MTLEEQNKDLLRALDIANTKLAFAEAALHLYVCEEVSNHKHALLGIIARWCPPGEVRKAKLRAAQEDHIKTENERTTAKIAHDVAYAKMVELGLLL